MLDWLTEGDAPGYLHRQAMCIALKARLRSSLPLDSSLFTLHLLSVYIGLCFTCLFSPPLPLAGAFRLHSVRLASAYQPPLHPFKFRRIILIKVVFVVFNTQAAEPKGYLCRFAIFVFV